MSPHSPGRGGLHRTSRGPAHRSQAGKITAKSLRHWRDARGDHRLAAHAAAGRDRRVSDSELVARIDELLGDVDKLLRSGAPEHLLAPVRADLDALAGDLERLELGGTLRTAKHGPACGR